MGASRDSVPTAAGSSDLTWVKDRILRYVLFAVVTIMVVGCIGVSLRSYQSNRVPSVMRTPSATEKAVVRNPVSFPNAVKVNRMYKVCTRDFKLVCCSYNKPKTGTYIADNPCECTGTVENVGTCTFSTCDVKCPGRKKGGKPVCCLARHWGKIEAANECVCKCLRGKLCDKK